MAKDAKMTIRPAVELNENVEARAAGARRADVVVAVDGGGVAGGGCDLEGVAAVEPDVFFFLEDAEVVRLAIFVRVCIW